jgi:hypothetical protein
MGASDWITVERPGWFGQARDERLKECDQKYGPGNWRIRHQLGPRLMGLDESLRLYELCYELHFLNPDTRFMWKNLVSEAKDVWTEEESDMDSGLDYSIQKAKAAHYEDIAIRRILQSYKMSFEGNRLIRIRADSKDLVGIVLSSIHIPFVFPQYIEPIKGFEWWNRHKGSLEYFWHSNKVLQVRQ